MLNNIREGTGGEKEREKTPERKTEEKETSFATARRTSAPGRDNTLGLGSTDRTRTWADNFDSPLGYTSLGWPRHPPPPPHHQARTSHKESKRRRPAFGFRKGTAPPHLTSSSPVCCCFAGAGPSLSPPITFSSSPSSLLLFTGEPRFALAGEAIQYNPGQQTGRNFSMQQMAMASFAVTSPSSHGNTLSALQARHSERFQNRRVRSRVKAVAQSQLQYQKLGDSDLLISEVTLGTMTFGEQNTEKEAHDILSYSFDQGVNILDTAESYPIPMNKETQGRTDLYIGRWMQSKPRDKIILATKVAGYSERSSYLRDNAKVVRVDAANIKESVEKSLKRLSTDYIDLLQIHWPDRYVALFGEFSYNPTKWRPSVPFEEQLKAFQELIDEGKVRYIGVSNETSYGVMEFVHAAKAQGLPKIVSIQNSYSLLVRCRFEVDLVEVCHPNNCNIGLLAYSPLAGGVLSGKYLDANVDVSKSRLNLFPGYMARYNASLAKEATNEYVKLAKKHGLTPVQLALGFVRDRPFTASSIIGATTMDQLKENIDAFTSTPRPLPQEVLDGIEDLFKRYKDPTIL